MSIPDNEEHFEALQKESDEHRIRSYDELLPEDKELMLKIEAISDECSKRGLSHLFLLRGRCEDPDDDIFYRFNYLLREGGKGPYSEGANEESNRFMGELAVHITNWFNSGGAVECACIYNGEDDSFSIKTDFFDEFNGYLLEDEAENGPENNGEEPNDEDDDNPENASGEDKY